MRRLLEIELDEAKNKLVGSAAADTPQLQGGARVLRFLLEVLTKEPSDITPKVESTNG